MQRDGKGGSFKLNAAVICAIGLMVTFFGAFVWLVHFIGSLHGTSKFIGNERFLSMLMPPVGVLMFLSVFPLIIFVCYSDDFEGLNPIFPHHYFFICQKTIKAFEGGKWKVSAKDL